MADIFSTQNINKLSNCRRVEKVAVCALKEMRDFVVSYYFQFLSE
jgi:hypothetical protein